MDLCSIVARDVETLLPLWCRAAEHALGLLVGSLLLAVPEEEAVEAAKQRATVTNLKRRLAESSVVTFFDWPLWLGPHPPTAAAQAKALQDWVSSRNASQAKDRKKPWQTAADLCCHDVEASPQTQPQGSWHHCGVGSCYLRLGWLYNSIALTPDKVISPKSALNWGNVRNVQCFGNLQPADSNTSVRSCHKCPRH
eukprot:2032642-Amphidinium_carterae.4